VWAGEHERVGFRLGEGVQVRADVGHDQGRHRDGALASVGLGRGEERLSTGYLAELTSDADGPTVTIYVGALESGQLTPPQAAEARKENERPVSRVDRIGQARGETSVQSRSDVTVLVVRGGVEVPIFRWAGRRWLAIRNKVPPSAAI